FVARKTDQRRRHAYRFRINVVQVDRFGQCEVTMRAEARDELASLIFQPAFDGKLETPVAVFRAARKAAPDFLAAAVRGQRELARQRQGFVHTAVVESELDDAALH